MMQGESAHLVRKLRDPFFLTHSLIYWSKAFSNILIKKMDNRFSTGIYSKLHYPQYIKKEVERKGETEYQKDYLLSFVSESGAAEEDGYEQSLFETIESGGFVFSYSEMPAWLQQYEDEEKTFSLHRWGWLLMHAVIHPSAYTKKWGIAVMKDWFLTMNDLKTHPAWESYSVSERIVNCLLFFYVLRNVDGGSDSDIRYIEQGLLDMAEHLAGHLEFHGSRTNNHILNNARALYMLGRLSSCRSIEGIGRKILTEETPKMITSEGFLREDSSSYHLLLLRTYLEILWCAECTGDDAFAHMIRPFTTSMVKAAWIFSIYDRSEGNWTLPLIGDVTPDFPVEWTSEICRSALALNLFRPGGESDQTRTGWNRIWGNRESEEDPGSNDIADDITHEVYEQSGWYRFDCADITLFSHVTPSGAVPLYSHGHNDIFSFVLYWKGNAVIIDPGRFSYLADSFGLYGKSADAHNAIRIDGSEPYPLNRGIYPTAYRRGNTEVQWGKNSEGYSFRISHDGFARMGKGIFAQREIDIRAKEIRIRDRVNGSGLHTVETLFHFGEQVNASYAENSSVLSLNVKGQNIRMKTFPDDFKPHIRLMKGQKDPHPAGWHFPQYGKAIPVTTSAIETFKELPYEMEYVLEFPE